MASEVDICNLSLSHLGESANISSIDPPEGSSYAESLAHFYPLARDIVLQEFPWGFAIRRVFLALVAEPGDDDNPYKHYVYALPSDCLSPVALLPKGGEDTDAENFDIESWSDGSQIVICDTPNAVMKYTRIVQDTTKFSPMFVDALAWLLASYMAGPIIKGDAGTAKGKDCLGVYQVQISNAKVAAMRGRKIDTGYDDFQPDWLAARGHTGFRGGR